MREIKFRAWEMSPYGNAMRYVDLYFFEEEGIREIPQDAQGHYEVMQFTGLKDRQGKDIYEGDILRVRFGKHTVEVRWKVTGFGFFNLGTQQWQLLYMTDLKQIEIIGNIYENPELLKEEMH